MKKLVKNMVVTFMLASSVLSHAGLVFGQSAPSNQKPIRKGINSQELKKFIFPGAAGFVTIFGIAHLICCHINENRYDSTKVAADQWFERLGGTLEYISGYVGDFSNLKNNNFVAILDQKILDGKCISARREQVIKDFTTITYDIPRSGIEFANKTAANGINSVMSRILHYVAIELGYTQGGNFLVGNVLFQKFNVTESNCEEILPETEAKICYVYKELSKLILANPEKAFEDFNSKVGASIGSMIHTATSGLPMTSFTNILKVDLLVQFWERLIFEIDDFNERYNIILNFAAICHDILETKMKKLKKANSKKFCELSQSSGNLEKILKENIDDKTFNEIFRKSVFRARKLKFNNWIFGVI